MDSALTMIYGNGGAHVAPPSGGGVGGGIGNAVAAPINAATSLGTAANHVTILGLVAILVLFWVLVRIANFRFVISTGVGR